MRTHNSTSRNRMDYLSTPASTFQKRPMVRPRVRAWLGSLAAVILAAVPCAHADVVTDSNAKAAEILPESGDARPQ